MFERQLENFGKNIVLLLGTVISIKKISIQLRYSIVFYPLCIAIYILTFVMISLIIMNACLSTNAPFHFTDFFYIYLIHRLTINNQYGLLP